MESVKYTASLGYTVKDLIFKDEQTSTSMSHRLTCHVSGEYPATNEGGYHVSQLLLLSTK